MGRWDEGVIGKVPELPAVESQRYLLGRVGK